MKKRLKRLGAALAGHGVWLFWSVLEGLVGGAVGILLVTLWLENR
jgi:hypothetical protein